MFVNSVRFLVPGTTGRFRCGGLNVALQTARLVDQLCPAKVVTYRQRQGNFLFLDDLLKQEVAPGDALWVVSWGYDVPKLLRRLRGRFAVYHAHSSGYGFDLPSGVPVLAVSRNTLGYWGDRAPRNPLFFVPNAIENFWLDNGARDNKQKRPVDVFVQRRKNSDYVLKSVVPSLEKKGLNVVVQSGWVDNLVDQFNSATVVIYDSSEYWRSSGVSEGFGLPPIEALACGCIVFSSLNHALADNIDPGLLGHQIGCGSLSFDVHRIFQAVARPEDWRPDSKILSSILKMHSETALKEYWMRTLGTLDDYFSNWSQDNLLDKPSSVVHVSFRRFLQRLRAIGF